VVNVNGRVLVLVPVALPGVTFMVSNAGAGEFISQWDAALGAQPTEAQLAAVPEQQAIDAEAAHIRSQNEARLRGIGNVWAVRLGGNVTDMTGAFQNAIGLHWPLEANRNYVFEFNGFYNAAAAANGLHLSLGGPAAPNSLRASATIAMSNSAAFAGVLNAYDAPIAATGSGGATVLPFTLRGNIGNGANAGNFGLRFRTSVNGSAVTIFSGSYGLLSPVLE
jgi:hypothetical protein